MKETLLNLDFTHWQAILLSGLPAFLNLFIFIYVRIKFPDDKISNIFSFYLVALIAFQANDTVTRMSASYETALLWNCILIGGTILMVPLGLHFTLLFTGRKKFLNSLAGQSFLYLPIPVFLIYMLLNKEEMSFIYSPFWGWVSNGGGSEFRLYIAYWLGMQGTLTLFFLLLYAWQAPPKSTEKKQSFIIGLGYVIPTIYAVVVQVIFSGSETNLGVPLTSTFMTSFSLGILIALKKYDLFSIADSLKTQTILEAMTDILIVLSPDKKIQFINKEGESALGVNNADKDSLNMEGIFSGGREESEMFMEKLFRPALEGKKTLNYSSEFISRSGVKIPVLISATPFRISITQVQVLLLVHDMSELHQTNKQLALREEQLKEKTEELNSFFYRTTHDLKGPIASIIGLTRLAKKDNTLPMATMCIDKIDQSASRLDKILLDFIKVMQIKEKVREVQLINFYTLTDDIIQSIKYSTGPDIVDFKVWIEPRIVFHGDEKLIDSILYNLIANAVNYRKLYAEEDPFVYVQIRKFGNGIMMKVMDNGIGMKQEIQGKIFSLFFRGNEDSKGTGLGLYILKNALDKLNGRVMLESEVNKGSTFTVYLPDLNPAMPVSDLNLVYSSAS